eukprot:5396098-Pleurochrysis_carterae.AAC.3
MTLLCAMPLPSPLRGCAAGPGRRPRCPGSARAGRSASRAFCRRLPSAERRRWTHACRTGGNKSAQRTWATG